MGAEANIFWKLAYPLKYVGRLVPFTRVAGGELREVKLTGKLKQTDDGFVYLEVPNSIIEAFTKMIKEDGIVNPSEVSSGKEYVGAHISVMYPEEIKSRKIKELGDEFEYYLDKMYTTVPESWEDVSKVYFISVQSAELEILRKKYKLPIKLKGNEFHITVGIIKATK